VPEKFPTGEARLTSLAETRTLSPMSPVEIVQRQLEAYNSQNLEAFAACYTNDVVATKKR
jgi:hypothetical protein